MRHIWNIVIGIMQITVKNVKRSRGCFNMACQNLFAIRPPKQVVSRAIIEIRELYQNLGRNVAPADFIVRIRNLRAVQHLRNVGLRKVGIFAKVADMRIRDCDVYHKYLFSNALSIIKHNKKIDSCISGSCACHNTP